MLPDVGVDEVHIQHALAGECRHGLLVWHGIPLRVPIFYAVLHTFMQGSGN